MTFMVICYSEINDLKFLLERSGLFAEKRLDRDLNILSNGHFLTMNAAQKNFIQKLALKDNVEKDVLVTGPVGSGKTLLGLEAINIKKSHYMQKYGISSSECQKKLRVINVIGVLDHESQNNNSFYRNGNQLKQQLEEMSKDTKDCALDIHIEYMLDSEKLTRIFQANEDYKLYLHTLIMLDEIWR